MGFRFTGSLGLACSIPSTRSGPPIAPETASCGDLSATHDRPRRFEDPLRRAPPTPPRKYLVPPAAELPPVLPLTREPAHRFAREPTADMGAGAARSGRQCIQL